jgi:glycosidase
MADGNDEAKLREALIFLYGLPGMPLLYYGTEQSFRGGTGPDWENRESMFAHGWKGNAPVGNTFGTNGRVFHHIAELNNARSRNRILRQGDCTVQYVDSVRQLIVLRRGLGARHAFVLFNASSVTQQWRPPLSGSWSLWPEHAGEVEADGSFRIEAGRAAWLLPLRSNQ